ncbi:MAG: hypothetical protein JWN98_203 [Abditibacteriota bacterium]|nr:hypothetical protein [Abditibacteriota bacterium]
MQKKWRDNGLSIVMLSVFFVLYIGQTIAGWHDFNNEQQDHGRPEITYTRYLTTGHNISATFENWESEFLQMAGYIILTIFLFQRGSAESKDPDKPAPVDEDPAKHQDDPDAPGPVKAGGWRLKLYEHSLSIAMLALFALAFVGHAIGSTIHHNQEAREHGEEVVTVWENLGSSHFWFESLQNWQSEFLAVFCIVVLSIRLRQKGSPESKPVHKPHSETGND